MLYFNKGTVLKLHYRGNIMIKKSKLLIGSTLILSVITLLSCFIPIIAKSSTRSQSTYTITTNDGYYAETTYFLTEQAYNNYKNSNESHTYSSRQANDTVINTKNIYAKNEESEFVIAAVQTVCVYEQSDDDGNITESRLLTSEEKESFETSSNTVSTYAVTSETIGSKKESLYYLNINMTVEYNLNNKQYTITGMASWADKLVWAWESYKAAEEDYFDYIGITWGGDRTFVSTSQSISGNYYNGNAVNFTRRTSDSYVGYVWQFNEKSGYLGKEMEFAMAKINIANIDTFKNKETNAKMTYIHTYGKINGTVSFNYNSNNNAAAGVTLSETEKQWQIEIDVPGIAY